MTDELITIYAVESGQRIYVYEDVESALAHIREDIHADFSVEDGITISKQKMSRAQIDALIVE